MYFLIKYEKLLEKYDEIWEKVKNIIKKEFDSEPKISRRQIKIL